MAYNFDKQVTVGDWEVQVDSGAKYGFFEHQKTGAGGGLWFEDEKDVLDEIQVTLRDYDGVYELPRQVAAALLMMGFFVGIEFQ
ncbi:hypothetical protein UFOVP26_40 [uncultured Caudovirales phage]|uniref:Uncharacterized protein n=1 Tax=uncultured Caudovirales phage TaxID=2100421 RepID=A0A6J5KP18_9CAUD|nr:hypothetical protein UFOVP26_40 [uncultured Caudovirales phage]CAB4123798.1 hypothetical protein UFOVP44_57 [uncultured Caudovirales phage]CAB5219223.1 hypothetical protein UFOVP220_48 [uncultured Caudovirales phage]